ncbi:hypothetical protein MASR2M15_19000 [Anaerolineales bacterium]
MKNYITILIILSSFIPIFKGSLVLQAQACETQPIIEQINSLDLTSESYEGDLFDLSLALQEALLVCAYAPDEAQTQRSIKHILSFTTLATIVEATSVGEDVEALVAELDSVYGDPFHGQSLYNGLEPVLDGGKLSCNGCHTTGAAPDLEGTWTRTEEIRLLDPELKGYSVRQYLVESVVLPQVYHTPGYEGFMPDGYGARLDLQQLADLIAYLESQDQLLDE